MLNTYGQLYGVLQSLVAEEHNRKRYPGNARINIPPSEELDTEFKISGVVFFSMLVDDDTELILSQRFHCIFGEISL